MSLRAEERSPWVDLTHGLNLSPVEIEALTAANSTTNPGIAFREALVAYRLFAMREARKRLVDVTLLDDTALRKTMDAIWVVYSPIFKQATAPMIAEAYIRAFRDAQAGKVPMTMVYALAEKHAERVGSYFNETSNEALIQGFNTYVNRQVPTRAALTRVLDAYGLSPRQMSGYTSATQLQPTKTESALSPKRLKTKLMSYIGKSITARLKVFQEQEAHNLEMQAQQVAWMWMVEQGHLPPQTEKMWLTAKDEKVCVQCGPMNAKKVRIEEKFKLPNGDKLYVPGAHVNCRCQIRLMVPPIIIRKADDDGWDPREHPRGGNPKNRGQFSRKPREYKEAERSPFLEEIMRGVEELRQEKPVDRPTLKLPPPKETPKLPSSASLPAPKAPPAPVAPKPSPKLPPPKPDEPQPTSGPKLPAAAAPKLPAPGGRPKLEANMEELERYTSEIQNSFQAYDKTPVDKIPTRKLKDQYGVQVPGYLVGSSDMIGLHQDHALLDDDQAIFLFTEQERKTRFVTEVTSHHGEQVNEAFASALVNNPTWVDDTGEESVVMVTLTDSFGGHAGDDEIPMDVEAEIPEDVLREAFEAALWNNPGYNERSNFAHEKKYSIQWHEFQNPDEVVGEDMLSAVELVQLAGEDPSEYRTVVMRIEDGYDTAAPASGDSTVWNAPGNYTVVNHKAMTVVDNDGVIYPYMQVDLRPKIRSERTYE